MTDSVSPEHSRSPVLPASPEEAGSPGTAVVTTLFGDRLAVAEKYADLLTGSAVERGLIGPREAPRIWERHILNCAVVGELIAPGSLVVDVGTGAGLPGLVLAIARPDLVVTLIEPLQRRTDWLEDAVESLGLQHQVTVVRDRAEDALALEADVVTARAVAPLAKLAAWCLPLTKSGGLFLALKGESAQAELDDAAAVLRQHRAREWGVELCGESVLTVPTRVVRVVAGSGQAPHGRSTRNPRRGARKPS